MKRSYFGRDIEERALLGGGVEAMKGVYQSIRAAEVMGYPCVRPFGLNLLTWF